MEPELISKKELLELTDISYGQLYRWKRKSLIPEDWFIRKSTFTGQETFFPRDKILARIEKIKNMKDDRSLDELAGVFSPMSAVASLPKEELLNRNIVSQISLQLYAERYGMLDDVPFERILFIYVLDLLLQNGDISLDEGKALLQVLTDHFYAVEGGGCRLLLVRKMGVSFFLLGHTSAELYVEAGVRTVVQLDLNECMEQLKLAIG